MLLNCWAAPGCACCLCSRCRHPPASALRPAPRPRRPPCRCNFPPPPPPPRPPPPPPGFHPLGFFENPRIVESLPFVSEPVSVRSPFVAHAAPAARPMHAARLRRRAAACGTHLAYPHLCADSGAGGRARWSRLAERLVPQHRPLQKGACLGWQAGGEQHGARARAWRSLPRATGCAGSRPDSRVCTSRRTMPQRKVVVHRCAGALQGSPNNFVSGGGAGGCCDGSGCGATGCVPRSLRASAGPRAAASALHRGRLPPTAGGNPTHPWRVARCGHPRAAPRWTRPSS